MKFDCNILSLNFGKYVHSKVYILLVISILFSFLYLLLDDSHFSGLNTIQELIKSEVIKARIETQIIKNNDKLDVGNHNNSDVTRSLESTDVPNNVFAHIENFTMYGDVSSTNNSEVNEQIKNKALDITAKKVEKEVVTDEITLEKIKPPIWQKYFNRLYYSVSSGCLLGFGDVYPISNSSKALTMIQAVITVSLIVY